MATEEELRRSEIRDWQRHDPEVNAARTGISDRDWERRVTMEDRNTREPQARSDAHRNYQQGQAQSQGGQKPELSAELQKLRSLSQGGQQPAPGAAKPPPHAPEATPHSGATTAGRHHQNSSQGPGRKQDTSPGRDRS